MTSWIIIVMGVLLVVAIVTRARPDITGPQARTMVGDGARLIDVRTAAEFSGGSLPGSRNLPVDEVPRRMQELEPKEKPIVLFCHSGMRSARAARMLKRAGFVTVHNLGSINRW